MSEERKKILNMLAEGKISVDEAERLLEAIGEGGKGGDLICRRHDRFTVRRNVDVWASGERFAPKAHGALWVESLGCPE